MYTTRSKNTKIQRIQKMMMLNAETIRGGLFSWGLEKRVTLPELIDFTLDLGGLEMSPYSVPIKVRVLDKTSVEHLDSGFDSCIFLIVRGNFCDLLLMIFMGKLKSKSSYSKFLPSTLQVKL